MASYSCPPPLLNNPPLLRPHKRPHNSHSFSYLFSTAQCMAVTVCNDSKRITKKRTACLAIYPNSLLSRNSLCLGLSWIAACLTRMGRMVHPSKSPGGRCLPFWDQSWKQGIPKLLDRAARSRTAPVRCLCTRETRCHSLTPS